MMLICIDDIVMDHIFLITPQLLTQALLGVDFCRMNNIIINFPKQYFTMEKDMAKCLDITSLKIMASDPQAQAISVRLTTAQKQA